MNPYGDIEHSRIFASPSTTLSECIVFNPARTSNGVIESMFQLVTLILTVKVRMPFVNYDINAFSLGEVKRSRSKRNIQTSRDTSLDELILYVRHALEDNSVCTRVQENVCR